ncbi:MAG: AMP-binding protein [Pseudomonadota bacterium]
MVLPRSRSYQALPQRLAELASLRPGSAAFTFLDESGESECRTFAQVDARARSLALDLLQAFSPGQRALLLYQPGPAFIEAFLACLYARMVAVPIYYPQNRDSDWDKLNRIAEDCEAGLCLCLGEHADKTAERRGQQIYLRNLPIVCTDRIETDQSQDDELAGYVPDDVAFLQYTSGSTGDPKGVMVTHRNMLHNLELIGERLELTGDSVGVSWLPPYHDMGLIGGILVPLFVGFHVVHMSPLSFLQRPLRWFQALSDYRATVTASPNFAYELCVQRIHSEDLQTLDLSAWRVVCNGAEPINPDTLEAFTRAMAPAGFDPQTYLCCYGMAESTLMITGQGVVGEPRVESVDRVALATNSVQPVNSGGIPLVSCGTPGLGMKVAIVEPASGLRLGPGSLGEIWVSGPSVAAGYWGLSELSAEVFGADLGDGLRYLRTGDLGFLSDGELFVAGRLKDLVVINGRNLYPQDLESVVVAADESLMPNSAACFAVPIEGAERLVVTVEVRRTHRKRTDADMLCRRIADKIASQFGVSPSHCVLLQPSTSLKTSSGKIRRGATRDAFVNGALRMVAEWQEGSGDAHVPQLGVSRLELMQLSAIRRKRYLLQAVMRMAAARTERKVVEIDPAASVLDIGLDSIALVEITEAVASGLEVELDSTVLFDNVSISALVDDVLARLDGADNALQSTTGGAGHNLQVPGTVADSRT